MRLSHCAATALSLALATSIAHADVTILGKPQLGVFPEIQAAVDAASQNDILVVEDDVYSGFVIHNKSLTVIAAPGALAEINGTCEVRSLGPMRTVTLIGLSVTGEHFITSQPALRLLDNLGAVRLQACMLRGSTTPSWQFGSDGGPGAQVVRSSKVIFTRCMVFGRSLGFLSGEAPKAGGVGLESLDSQVALYECVVRGGKGSEETYPAGGAGGDGCRVSGWGVFASGTTIEGGRGGGGDYLGLTVGGDGGHALVIEDATAKLYDGSLTGGLASTFPTPGVAGQRVMATNALVNEYGSQHRSLGGPTETSDNATVVFNVGGKPGDTVELLVSSRSVFTYMSSLSGVSTVAQPWNLIPVGTIGPSGTLAVPYFIADQTWPQAGRTLNFQAVVTNGLNQRFLSSPIQVLVRNN
mgnify:CR=1 FL=1